MKTIKLIIIDEKMNSVEVEINSLQYKSMGLDLSKVKKHEKKRDLNMTITEFLEKNKEEL
jgi:hypothetical protein